MARYRLKEQVFEAVQFDPEGLHRHELPAGVERDADGQCWLSMGIIHRGVVAGDWIVTGPSGMAVVVSDGHFRATYEPIEEKPERVISGFAFAARAK